MTESELKKLENKLWSAADKMRGAVSVSDYKFIVLGLIFLRYADILYKQHKSEINKGNAQLIFSTHDTNLLSLTIFRRDQIWFTEKNYKNGSTDLYPLDEFPVRKNENIQKGYLNGRYGAIPFIAIGEELWQDQ